MMFNHEDARSAPKERLKFNDSQAIVFTVELTGEKRGLYIYTYPFHDEMLRSRKIMLMD